MCKKLQNYNDIKSMYHANVKSFINQSHSLRYKMRKQMIKGTNFLDTLIIILETRVNFIVMRTIACAEILHVP